MNRENSINDRVKELRTQLGMTQEQFAKKLGYTQQTICQWEHGARYIRDAAVSSICANFNVDERWLRTGEGETFREPEGALDLARTLRRAIYQSIFDSMPENVRDAFIANCRKISLERRRRRAEALKAMENEETQETNKEVQVEETKA